MAYTKQKNTTSAMVKERFSAALQFIGDTYAKDSFLGKILCLASKYLGNNPDFWKFLCKSWFLTSNYF